MWAPLRARNRAGRVLAIMVTITGLVAAIPASASAAITASSIATPTANFPVVLNSSQSSSTATAFTVSGTASGTGSVDIDCVRVNGTSSMLVTNVSQSGTFSVAVTYQQAYAVFAAFTNPCVLRAVPTGSSANGLKPGASTPFAGPLIDPELQVIRGGSQPYDFFDTLFDTASSGTTGALLFDSAGSCGLSDSWLYANSTTLTQSGYAFSCAGAIFGPYNPQGSSSFTPDEIIVDGHNGALDRSFGTGTPSVTGFQPGSFTDTYASGELTIQDNEPVMLCGSPCANGALPSSWTPSGVALQRTWQTTSNGLVALQTDVFKSTDGNAHSLTVAEDNEFGPDSSNPESVNFPGTSGAKAYAPGDAIAPVAGPGTIYINEDANAPASGDPALQWPQAAIVYTRAPSSPMVFTYWSATSYPEFYMPYSLQIPAGGTAVLRFAYVQDYALSDVQSLAKQALASFDPTLSIGSPTSNSTSSSPAVTVTGSAVDAAGIKSLTVDGASVQLSASGSFSAPLTLPVGANTITVVATDTDGLTTTQTASVTVAKQTTTGLSTKLKKRTAKKFPYSYALNGTLALPAGITATAGCNGKITLTVRRGHKKLLTKNATVASNCNWSALLKLATRKLAHHHGKLTITPSFAGNTSINPYTAKPLTVHYGH